MPPAERLVPPALRGAVLSWYDRQGRRSLSFRASRDPYAILVSEAMAQQTQVARAAERWTGFVARFPTLADLAAASPADVLRAWQGLGYNRRAINLWRAARVVASEMEGRLPEEPVALERLPGIGPYTARAVAAIAFGRPVGPVDTNVRRVLRRVVGGARPLSERQLQTLADAIVPADRPADWTHALMDLGATVCRPRRPDCAACPAAPWCRSRATPLRAAVEASPAGRLGPGPIFPRTSRWLRGRILERLRGTADGEWLMMADPVGDHSSSAVTVALAALERDGLVELHPADRAKARLPIG